MAVHDAEKSDWRAGVSTEISGGDYGGYGGYEGYEGYGGGRGGTGVTLRAPPSDTR